MQHPARANMAKMNNQEMLSNIDPDALYMEAKGVYEDIKALTAQVNDGVLEAEPALEQAKAKYAEIVGIAEQSPNINTEQFVSAIQEDGNQDQKRNAIMNSQMTQDVNIEAPNPILQRAKQGLGSIKSQ